MGRPTKCKIRDFTIQKETLLESETPTNKEVTREEIELIEHYKSNDPDIGYNKWPKYKNK